MKVDVGAMLPKQLMEKKAFRYVLVGGSSAVIELAVFNAILYGFQPGVPTANIIAVITSTIYNFIANKSFTFGSSGRVVQRIALYLVLWLVNLCFTTIATTALVGAGVFPLVAKLATMACVVVWNFVLYKKIIYR